LEGGTYFDCNVLFGDGLWFRAGHGPVTLSRIGVDLVGRVADAGNDVKAIVEQADIVLDVTVETRGVGICKVEAAGNCLSYGAGNQIRCDITAGVVGGSEAAIKAIGQFVRNAANVEG